MKMTKIVAGLLAAGVMSGAHAAPLLLSEGFDDMTVLGAAGWVFTNPSGPVGLDWFQGNSGIFAAQSGAADSYAGANFNSAPGGIGVVDNWLISPELVLGAGSVLSFFTRTEMAGYFDLLEVRFGSGSSSLLANFTTLLGTVGSGGSYPADDWTEVTLNLPTSVSGRVAFRYSVADANDANYIGIDSVTVAAATAVPEPTTWLLAGLGLAAVGATRRRQPSTAVQASV